jgi:hypothetical protein
MVANSHARYTQYCSIYNGHPLLLAPPRPTAARIDSRYRPMDDVAHRFDEPDGKPTIRQRAPSAAAIEDVVTTLTSRIRRSLADSEATEPIDAELRQALRRMSREARAVGMSAERLLGAGDFSMPMFIHMQTVPGASVMAARHALITYAESDLPNGGQLRITTSDSVALDAIHQFLAFQRQEHHAPGAGPAEATTSLPAPP